MDDQAEGAAIASKVAGALTLEGSGGDAARFPPHGFLEKFTNGFDAKRWAFCDEVNL